MDGGVRRDLCKDEHEQLVSDSQERGGKGFCEEWGAQRSLLGPEGCGCSLCVQEGCCGMGMGRPRTGTRGWRQRCSRMAPGIGASSGSPSSIPAWGCAAASWDSCPSPSCLSLGTWCWQTCPSAFSADSTVPEHRGEAGQRRRLGASSQGCSAEL